MSATQTQHKKKILSFDFNLAYIYILFAIMRYHPGPKSNSIHCSVHANHIIMMPSMRQYQLNVQIRSKTRIQEENNI